MSLYRKRLGEVYPVAEAKNTDFDRPGGYASPVGAAHVQRAARDVAGAGITLLGDSVAGYRTGEPAAANPDFEAADPSTRVFVGDCRDVLAGLDERGAVDLVFADPPFNWEVPYDQWHDGMPRAEYERFTFDWLSGRHRVTFWSRFANRRGLARTRKPPEP